MSHSRPPPNRIEQRVKAEARAAVTCLMPRTDDDPRKETLRLFVILWFFWTFCIEAGFFTRGPTVIGGFTFHTLLGFLIFYAFARLHELEVERFIPLLDAPSRESGGRQYADRDQEAHDDREDGSTGGFVFRSDRDSDDEQ